MATQIGNKNTVLARKDHRCGLCTYKINKGEKYESSFCSNDGTVYTFKNHIKCGYLLDILKMHDHADEGVDSGFFQCDIIDQYDRLCPLTNNHNVPFIDKLNTVIEFCEELLKEKP